MTGGGALPKTVNSFADCTGALIHFFTLATWFTSRREPRCLPRMKCSMPGRRTAGPVLRSTGDAATVSRDGFKRASSAAARQVRAGLGGTGGASRGDELEKLPRSTLTDYARTQKPLTQTEEIAKSLVGFIRGEREFAKRDAEGGYFNRIGKPIAQCRRGTCLHCVTSY